MKKLGRSAVVAAVAALLVCSSCVTQVSLSEPQSASEPATTILYTGVRSEVRRFPDYGSIDQSILASEQKHETGSSHP